MADQTYVEEILDAARKMQITREDDFFAMCQKDINAGYKAEVVEAWKRYRSDPQVAQFIDAQPRTSL